MKDISAIQAAFVLALLLCTSAVGAVVLPPIPTEPIYFEPPVEEATQKLKLLSCVELDQNIRYLHPYRYTYKPAFHEDKANTIATALITADAIPIVGGLVGVGYLSYSALIEEKENRRMLNVEQKISMLQQLKAEQHCFE